MVRKKTFFVLACCLGFTLLSTGISNVSAADKFSNLGNGHSGKFEGFKQQGLRATSTQSIMLGNRLADKLQLALDDLFMMNTGLPYDQIKDTAVWGKYICFLNKSVACLDNTDPQDPAKTIYPFDLLKGDLVYENITDISANDNILYVATDKNIYKFKFVLVGDGKFTGVGVKGGALQITAYKGGVFYMGSDGVLSGADCPIPAFNSGIKDLLSTKSYLLIAGENSIYRWKPGLGDWETVIDGQTIRRIAPDYKNDELYAAVEVKDGGSQIMRCLLKPQLECSEFWSDPQEEITSLFLDGNKLYKVTKDNDISWADKDAKNPFFSYVASADAEQSVAKAIDGSIYAHSQSGIKVFIDKGLDAPSEWSKKSIKPSMLSVKGGSFTKPWAGGLFLVKENVLYRQVNSLWEKKLDNVSDFAVTGNYGLIYNGGKIDLVDFADIMDGVTPDVHHSIKSPSFVTAMTADAEKVFIATSGHLHECPLPTDKDIDLKDCLDTEINAIVNDLTNIPALEEEVLVCAENGLYRWVKGADKLKSFIATPCKAATFVNDDLYMINDMGDILMLDANGKIVKQLCQKLQPMKGGLEAKDNAFYISDLKRGVVVADKKLFTEKLCPATEAPAPEPYVLVDFDSYQLCNDGMCKGIGIGEKECTNDADCPTGKVCKSDMCIDDINAEVVANNECTVNGATGVLDENGNCSATDPCKQELEIEQTNSVPSGDEKTYGYNSTVDLNFKVKDAKPGDNIKWTVSRDTEIYYTKSGKQYIDKWNENVPNNPLFHVNNDDCMFGVDFRLGNSKEYKAGPYKTRLSIIDYFKHKITVTATLEQNQSQCGTKSVTATKELNFKFNKPKLEDESIYGSVLAYKSYVEWVNSFASLDVSVQDADHNDLGSFFQLLSDKYEEGHIEEIKPLLWPKSKGSTFKDVEFFKWAAHDISWGPGLYFNLNYLLLAGKDMYAIVGSGWDKMKLDGSDESWHWQEGVDFTWFMRCHPDSEDSGEPNMEEMLACGEEQGGGNM